MVTIKVVGRGTINGIHRTTRCRGARHQQIQCAFIGSRNKGRSRGGRHRSDRQASALDIQRNCIYKHKRLARRSYAHGGVVEREIEEEKERQGQRVNYSVLQLLLKVHATTYTHGISVLYYTLSELQCTICYCMYASSFSFIVYI